MVLTILHAGGKFGGAGYQVSGGLHGVGVSVVNALSTHLEVEVHRDGAVYRQSYDRGVPTAPLTQGESTTVTGTTVTFWPDAEVFDTTWFDFTTLSRRFQEMAFLNKGLSLELTDERRGAAPVIEWRKQPIRQRSRSRAFGITTRAASLISSDTSTPAKAFPAIDHRNRLGE